MQTKPSLHKSDQRNDRKNDRSLKIGIMTGGGDAPGLNSVIESVSRTLLAVGHQVLGICDGFEGIFGHQVLAIEEKNLIGLHALAGTLLGTSNRCGTQGREEEFLQCYRRLGLDGLVVAGGDGTFSGLKPFRGQVPIIGVPKTIDNDISGTDVSFGFDTACSVVARSVDALRATAQAHRRIMIVETMGRTAGWIALGGGLASYSEAILLPERPFDKLALKQFLLDKQKSLRGLVMVVAEGARAQGEDVHVALRVPGSPQEERYGGIGLSLARWVEAETGWESRHVVLGHLQRSENPTPTDRFLTLAMGVEVARMVIEGQWHHCAVYRGGTIHRAPIDDLMSPARLVSADHRWVKLAHALGLFC